MQDAFVGVIPTLVYALFYVRQGVTLLLILKMYQMLPGGLTSMVLTLRGNGNYL